MNIILICNKFLFLPQYHHHQYTLIYLLYLYIGYKTDPYVNRNVGRFFLRIKEITAIDPLQILLSWIFFLMDQILFFRVNVLIHELSYPSHIFSLHHKTQFPLHFYFPQSNYSRNKIFTVLLYMVQIFGVTNEESTTNDIHRGKNSFPNSAC